MIDDYRRAGIDIVAIGSDTVSGLSESLTTLGADRGEFDLRLLSDRKLRVFYEWLAFDEFEHTPMHGLFLLDGAGKLRWQDIRHEPFTEVKWLLSECRRLLASS